MSVQMTAVQVQRHLVGLDSWLAAASQSIAVYDDNYIESLVVPAIRLFETETHYRIEQVQISSLPDGAYAPAPTAGAYAPAPLSAGLLASNQIGAMGGVGGTMTLTDSSTFPYEIESPYAYWTNDQQSYGRLMLNQAPVLAVQRVRVAWSADPADTFYKLPEEWIRWNPETGEFWLLPVKGSSVFSAAAAAYQILNLQFAGKDYVPGIMSVDYVVGLPSNWQSQRQFSHFQRKLEECVAYQVLEDISEAYDAGLMNKAISAMGWNQGLNYSRFQQRKAELLKSIQDFKKQVQLETEGVMMDCLIG